MGKITKPTVDPTLYALPVTQGGDGAMNPTQGALNLQLVTSTMRGAANGAVPLNSTGKVDSTNIALPVGSNAVNLDGVFSVAINEVVSWTITDYDSFKTYALSASSGTISMNNGIITYTAPGATGQVTLNISGRQIQFNVLNSQPGQAQITSPTKGSTNVSTSPTITTNEFSYKGAVDTHASTDWQLSTNSNFSSFVYQSLNDSVNKTSWTPGTLSQEVQYFTRARHKGASGTYGQWSTVSNFSTSDVPFASIEESKILGPVEGNTNFALQSVAISGDGQRIVVGAPAQTVNGNSGIGRVYVYVRSGGTWVEEAAFNGSGMQAGYQDGAAVDIDYNGSRIIVGVPGYGAPQSNSGRFYIYSRSGSTWTENTVNYDLVVGTNMQNGASVAISGDGNRAIIGGLLGGATPQYVGTVYIYSWNGSSWVREAHITNPTNGQEDAFGGAVDINSDGSRVVIGVTGREFGSSTNQGAAYIYSRSGTTWSQEAYLPTAEIASNVQFGAAVSMSSDGSRVCIGTPQLTVDASVQGGVYVYSRSGTTWTQEARLTIADSSPGMYFGNWLSMNGSGDKIAINDRYNSNQGSFYLFKRTGTTWNRINRFFASDGATSDFFGRGISFASNGSRIAVAGPLNKTAGVTRGAVYTFAPLTGSGPFISLEEAKLMAAGGENNNSYGWGIAITPDGSRVIVGAYNENTQAANQGAAYIYVRSGNSWSQETKFIYPTGSNNYMGIDCAISADGSMAVIGAYGQYTGQVYGIVHYLTRIGSTWTHQTTITPSGEPNNSPGGFGYSVDISADGTKLIGGANTLSVGGNSSQGAAFIFTRSGNSWSQQAKLTAPDGAAGDGFGYRVSMSSDGTRVVVSTPFKVNTPFTQAGAAYVYLWNGSTWNFEQKLLPSDPASNEFFGEGTAITSDGSRIFIGVKSKDVGGNQDQGAAYVFVRSGTTWTQEAKVVVSDPAANDNFAFCVSCNSDGSKFAAGAHQKTVSGKSAQGALYLFARNGSTWTQENKFVSSDGVASDNFGTFVAMAGDGTRVAASAIGVKVASVVAGAVYVFR